MNDELSFVETLQRAGLTEELIGKVPRLSQATIQSIDLTDSVTIRNLAGHSLWWLVKDGEIVDTDMNIDVIAGSAKWWIKYYGG